MKLIDFIINAFLLKYYKVSTGTGLCCEGRLIIQGHGTYKIGNNVRIISKESVNPVGGGATVLQTLDEGVICIGNNVGISHCIFCARESIIIEDKVMLGGGVKIYDNDFHSVDFEQRFEKPDTHIGVAPVRIKHGAFIGAHTIILKGVTIGEKSVVGAGSVVTKSIPDGEIWAGNPAKFIKKIETTK